MAHSLNAAVSGAGGLAALSICESLLISLTEKGILERDEAYFVLEDAVNAHRCAVSENRAAALHEAAAALIEQVMAQSSAIGVVDRADVAKAVPANDVVTRDDRRD